MKSRHVLFLPLVLAAGSAFADPDDYVSTLDMAYGEKEIDFKYGVATEKDEPTEQAASLGVGYGVTEWWFTEFYLKGMREGSRSAFDAFEWENKFLLTEIGKYPVDVGFLAEFELPHDRNEGNEFQFGPLFQAEFGRVQVNFNPLLANISRAVEENGTYLRYQWQVRYRWQDALDFGVAGIRRDGPLESPRPDRPTEPPARTGDLRQVQARGRPGARLQRCVAVRPDRRVARLQLQDAGRVRVLTR